MHATLLAHISPAARRPRNSPASYHMPLAGAEHVKTHNLPKVGSQVWVMCSCTYNGFIRSGVILSFLPVHRFPPPAAGSASAARRCQPLSSCMRSHPSFSSFSLRFAAAAAPPRPLDLGFRNQVALPIIVITTRCTWCAGRFLVLLPGTPGAYPIHRPCQSEGREAFMSLETASLWRIHMLCQKPCRVGMRIVAQTGHLSSRRRWSMCQGMWAVLGGERHFCLSQIV
ncbi:hypothetical protein B0T19DRAFT_209579 [Cercophora scortea]|uniref:Uncharacterized protein n=1 Tax=Cercophora scortea TaxID=314031 RepID=A0AAE0M8U8_9PEZI|nr:hypothetical protein B0T19DRAFT_209579 [Cercophora scortea]